MRAVLQRVSSASVSVDEKIISQIQCGLLILLGIEDSDSTEDIQWLVSKIIKIRIFNDENGVMNCSVLDVHGEVIIVSQFTLLASTKKGNRPSYTRSAKPEISKPLYKKFIDEFEKQLGKRVGTGEFGAHMNIQLVNDGPVTILLDTKNKE